MSDTWQAAEFKNPFKSHFKRWNMKIGKIFDLMQTPCATDDLTMFVLAPFSELPTLLYSLASHECLDAAWDGAAAKYTSAKRRGGYKHGRGGIPNFKSKGFIRAEKPHPSNFGWAAFKGGQFLQYIGARILIIDTALNWNINWMSTALEWSGCPPEPDCWSSGSLVGPVYGDHCSPIRFGCNAIGGGKNCLGGIGGFSTIVPVSRLMTFGAVNCVPFGSAPFNPMIEQGWRVFNKFTGDEVGTTQESHGEDTLDGVGTQLWQKATFGEAGAISMEGYMEAVDPCTPGQGGQIGYSPYYITGDQRTSLRAAINQDPCDGGILTQIGGFRK